MLNGKDQDANAVAKILAFESKPDAASVTIDLTSAYADHANSAVREVALVDQRRAVLVRDTFVLKAPCEIAWGMTTDADIEVHDNGSATLTLDGKTLTAQIQQPEGARFTTESAEQEPPQRPNRGVKRLVVRRLGEAGKNTVEIKLTPRP
jgi:hypothetical protein